MPLIGRRLVSFSFEDMPQVSATVAAYDLGPLHAKSAVRVPGHRSWHGVEESRPPAARLKLVIRCIEWRVAARASIHAFVRMVLVIFSGEGRFGALLSKNAKLFYMESK